MPTRILKWVLGSILGIVLLAAAAYGVLILVNAKDEELSPEAKAFADQARLDVPPEQNGYFVLLGWRAPEGTDPHAAGIADFREWAEDIREKRFIRKERAWLLPSVDMDVLCKSWKTDCLETVRTRRAAVEFQLAKHETQRRRIRDMAKYPFIHAPDVPYHPLAQLVVPDFSWRLGITESAYAWESGRTAEALVLSDERIAMARRMIRDSSDWLYTFLGSIWLRAEYLLLLEFMQNDPQAVRAHGTAFEKLLRSLAPDELHSSRWICGSFARVNAKTRAFTTIPAQRRSTLGSILLGTSNDVQSATDDYQKNLPWWFPYSVWIASPLFQPNATANAHLPFFLALAQGAREGTKGASALASKQRASMAFDSDWRAYNLIGRVADSGQAEDYLPILLRLHDIDRFRRLVAVHGALVMDQIPLTGIEAFLAAYPDAIDPTTGKSMRWDAARSRLYVDALYPSDTKLEHRRIGDVEGQISVAYRP